MEIDPTFLDDNPLQWIIDHQNTNGDYDLSTFEKIFIEKISIISRINLNEFVKNMKQINIEYLKMLRCKLIQMCAILAPSDSIPIKKTAAQRIAENIYHLIQMVVNKKSLSTEILATIWKSNIDKQIQKSQQTSNFIDLYDDPIEHFHLLMEENNYKYDQKIKELTDKNIKLENQLQMVQKKLNEVENKVDGTLIYNSKLTEQRNKTQSINQVNNTPNITGTKLNYANLFASPNRAPSAALKSSTVTATADSRKRSHNSSDSNKKQNEQIDKTNSKQSKKSDNESSPSHKQPRLLSFNSFDPNSLNVPLSHHDLEEGWKKVGKKKRLINNNNNNNNKNSNKQNSNANYYNNNCRQRKYKNNNWLKSVGTGNDEDFIVSQRQFKVYLGRANQSMKIENVEKLLQKMNVSYKDIKQINNPNSSFNSFVFSIDYIKKDIVNQKDLWPSGLVINRYFYKRTLSVASGNENTTIPTNNTATTSQHSATSASTSTQMINNTKPISQ